MCNIVVSVLVVCLLFVKVRVVNVVVVLVSGCLGCLVNLDCSSLSDFLGWFRLCSVEVYWMMIWFWCVLLRFVVRVV